MLSEQMYGQIAMRILRSECVCARLLSCPTLCDPIDCSPPGSSVYAIFQARILEWIGISFPGDLPRPGIKPVSLALAGGFFATEPPRKPHK